MFINLLGKRYNKSTLVTYWKEATEVCVETILHQGKKPDRHKYPTEEKAQKMINLIDTMD